MTRPDAGLGEVPHAASLSLNPTNHLMQPQHSSHENVRFSSQVLPREQQHTYSEQYCSEPPFSVDGSRSCGHSAQPHALQQLANTLKLQSLALKSRSSRPSDFFFQQDALKPLEADDAEEDVENDPIFQSYQRQLISRRARDDEHHTSDEASTPSVDTDTSMLNADDEKDKASSANVPVATDFSYQEPELTADATVTNQFLEGTSRLVHPTRDHDGIVAPQKVLGAASVHKCGDRLLVFRRSAQVAAQCPLVVHRAVRMRRRTKPTTKNASLPRDGEKGKALAAELDERLSSCK